VLERLNQLVHENHVSAGSLTAIGSVEKAEVGFFVGNGRYLTISCSGPLEVSSCVGNVSSKQGVPFVHAHISLADKQGKGYGGHLMTGCIVDPTFEVILHAYDDLDLGRELDPLTKLYLLDT
jgi:hypothetical protein